MASPCGGQFLRTTQMTAKLPFDSRSHFWESTQQTLLCMNQMIYWQGYARRHYRSSEDWKRVSIALWDTVERMRTVSTLGVG